MKKYSNFYSILNNRLAKFVSLSPLTGDNLQGDR